MLSRTTAFAWIGIILLSGMFLTILMGQDCAAQSDPCDPDPCQGIPNAITATCTAVGGACTPATDFVCSCDTGYAWQDATNTCLLVGPMVQVTGFAQEEYGESLEQGTEISLNCSSEDFPSTIEEGGNFSIPVTLIEAECTFNDATYDDGFGGTNIYNCISLNCSFPITATDTEIALGDVFFVLECIDIPMGCVDYCLNRPDLPECPAICAAIRCN